jgi:hypothetical protein
MRFMMLMIPKGYENAKPGTIPDPKAIEAMMKYNESLQKAGVLLALDGLHPPSMGARITFACGKSVVTQGPTTRCCKNTQNTVIETLPSPESRHS